MRCRICCSGMPLLWSYSHCTNAATSSFRHIHVGKRCAPTRADNHSTAPEPALLHSPAVTTGGTMMPLNCTFCATSAADS